MIEKNKLILGNCKDILSTYPDNIADLIITSPPYDNLRTYEGLVIWDFYVFCEIAELLYKILAPGGVLVWVVGDSIINGSESGNSFKQALFFTEQLNLNLHDTMLYQKIGNSFPDKTTYNQNFDYMFVFSKGKPKTINLLKQKNKWGNCSTFGVTSDRNREGKIISKKKRIIAEEGVRNNIWRYHNGQGYSHKDLIERIHPAMFPEQLAKDHILSWSNVNDLVIDPFMGSGTVPLMCLETNRNYLGIELVPKYFQIAEDRINKKKDELKHSFLKDLYE